MELTLSVREPHGQQLLRGFATNHLHPYGVASRTDGNALRGGRVTFDQVDDHRGKCARAADLR
jgi:hypothetical protein